MSLKTYYAEALQTAKKFKNLLVFFVLTHAVLLAFGQWMVASKNPGVLAFRAAQLQEIQNLPYLKPLTGPLADSLALKILYTFFFNLVFGAFLSTTLTGVAFFFPYIIAVWRSFIVGILVFGLNSSPAAIVVFYGTFILEFGAYCISSAAGTDLGLAIISPARKGKATRVEAVKESLRDMVKLYRLVVLILFISAIWEISWLEYLGPLIKPAEAILK